MTTAYLKYGAAQQALTIPQFADLLKNGHWDITVAITDWVMDKTKDAGIEMWLSMACGGIIARRGKQVVRFPWLACGGCGFSYEEAREFDNPQVDPDRMVMGPHSEKPDPYSYLTKGIVLVSESGGALYRRHQEQISKALNGLNGFNEAVAEAIAYKLSIEEEVA